MRDCVGVVQQYNKVLSSAPGGSMLAANLTSLAMWLARRWTDFFMS
jgi:hypothetical protein